MPLFYFNQHSLELTLFVDVGFFFLFRFSLLFFFIIFLFSHSVCVENEWTAISKERQLNKTEYDRTDIELPFNILTRTHIAVINWFKWRETKLHLKQQTTQTQKKTFTLKMRDPIGFRYETKRKRYVFLKGIQKNQWTVRKSMNCTI